MKSIFTFLLLSLLLAASCSQQHFDEEGQPVVTSEAEAEELQIIRQHARAFNRHDVPAMMQHIAPSFQWSSIMKDTTIIEVTNRDELEQAMTSYFQSLPTVRSEIEEAVVSGAFVAIRERASWQGKQGELSQTALGIYEVRGGLIQRVWYYPAER